MHSAEIIREYLEKDNWKYEVEKENEDVVIFRLRVTINGKISVCDIRIVCDERFINSCANISVFADEKCYADVAEFITRVNYELATTSRFEMDFTDGEIRACYLVDCRGKMQFTEEVVKGIIYSPLYMFDSYGDALLEVLFGYVTPEDAVNRLIEQLEEDAVDEIIDTEDGFKPM